MLVYSLVYLCYIHICVTLIYTVILVMLYNGTHRALTSHLPAATNVRHGDDTTQMVHEDGATDAEGRCDGDIETAVTVE